MPTKTLDVYFDDNHIGKLLQNGRNQWSFNFLAANTIKMPLSLALPTGNSPYLDQHLKTFFINMLPEEKLRARTLRAIGLSDTNDFGLLTAIAGDTPGAISLHAATSYHLEEDKHFLTPDDLKNLPGLLAHQPFFIGQEKVRLTLSGAQIKLPIGIENNKIYLPRGLQASTHILKTALPDFPNSVENEWFCMKLARAMGLPVPSVNILRMNTPFYIVKRFDRQLTAEGKVTRLHQEDFCQAFGVLPHNKYEWAGGPSLVQAFNLLRKNVRQPAHDIQLLLQWVIFNFLIGNSDGHGKNIALLLEPNGPQLAPFYDLMCTSVYPGLTDKLAMNIGGENRPMFLKLEHWHQLADEIGVKRLYIERLLNQFASRIGRKAQELATAFHPNTTIIGIVEIIHERTQFIAKMISTSSSRETMNICQL